MDRLFISFVLLRFCLMVNTLPIVDPGLFVIMGVQTCREGKGYCMLGQDCSLDEDFVADELRGHCDGLRSAFTPSAHFICCRYSAETSTTEAFPTTTDINFDPEDPSTMTDLDSESRTEAMLKALTSTVRSYEVFETHSETSQPRLNKLSRLDDMKESADEPFHVKLTIAPIGKNEVKGSNNDSFKNKYVESVRDKDVVVESSNDSHSVSNESSISAPVICFQRPRSMEDTGPLTFPMCLPLPPSSPSLDISNKMENIESDVDPSRVQLSTQLSVNNVMVTRTLKDNAISSVTAGSDLKNTNDDNGTVNGTKKTSSMIIPSFKRQMSHLNNSAGNIEDTVNNIYNLLTSFNVKPNISGTLYTTESATVTLNDAEYTDETTPLDEFTPDTTNDFITDETTEILGETDNEEQRTEIEDETLSTYHDYTTETLHEDKDEFEISPTSTERINIPAITEVSINDGQTTEHITTTQAITNDYSTIIEESTSTPRTSTASKVIPVKPIETQNTPTSEKKIVNSNNANLLQDNKLSSYDKVTVPIDQIISTSTEIMSVTSEVTTENSNSNYNSSFADSITTPRSVSNNTTNSISYKNSTRENNSVCVGKFPVSQEDNCWLVHLRDARTAKILCPGALLTNNMVLTAASCIIDVYNAGTEHIEVVFANGGNDTQRIRDIIVHENYRTSRSHPAQYDMGLVRLDTSAHSFRRNCVICVAEPTMDVDSQRCHTILQNISLPKIAAGRDCRQGSISESQRSSVINMCSTHKVSPGSPLICNGMLAGVASSWEQEQTFTPINLAVTWLKNNELIT